MKLPDLITLGMLIIGTFVILVGSLTTRTDSKIAAGPFAE